jgi:hypothetical protein
MVVALAKWTVQNAAPAACYLLGSSALQLSADSLRYRADRHIMAHGMSNAQRLAASGLHFSLIGASFCCTLKSVQAFKRHKQRKWVIRHIFEFPPTLFVLLAHTGFNVEQAKKSVASFREDWLCFSVFRRMIRLKQQQALPSFFSSDNIAALFQKDSSGHLGLSLAFFKSYYHSYIAIKTEQDDEAFSFFYGKYKELLFLYLDYIWQAKTVQNFRASLSPEQRNLFDFYNLFVDFTRPQSTWKARQTFGHIHNFEDLKAAFNDYNKDPSKTNTSSKAQAVTGVKHQVSAQWQELLAAVKDTTGIFSSVLSQTLPLTEENVHCLELSKVQALSEKLKEVAKLHFGFEVKTLSIPFTSSILSLSPPQKKTLKKEIKALRLVWLRASQKKLHTDKCSPDQIINCVSQKPEEIQAEQKMYASETSKHVNHLLNILGLIKGKLKTS